jgi:hypothetical protein
MVVFLKLPLDVGILDINNSENAERLKINMLTAMGMNELVYCFLLSVVTYGY